MNTQAKDAVALAMDWLAQLRDEDGAGPSPGGGEPAIDGAPPAGDSGDVPPAAPPAGDFEDAAPAMPRAAHPWPAAAPPTIDWDDVALVAPPASDPGATVPAMSRAADPWPAAAPLPADWEDAAPAMPPETAPPGRAGAKADIEITERAAIGDELRMPLAWCEMGSCISHYEDPAALGEADIRARAIEAGWRVDALGRLACPQCHQGDCWFWTAHPVALWDRDRAVAMTALMAAATRQRAGADGAAGMQRGASLRRHASAPAAVPGPRPEMTRQSGRGRHRGHPAHPDRA